MPCLEHLAQLRGQQEALNKLGAVLLVVANAPPARAASFVTREALPEPVLMDPDRRAYTAFGLTRARLRELLTWRTVMSYARGFLRGHWPQWPRGDVAQLGGVFVIDGLGALAFAHRGRDPADWPPVDHILAAVRSTADGSDKERR